jgi:hypothetical protein
MGHTKQMPIDLELVSCKTQKVTEQMILDQFASSPILTPQALAKRFDISRGTLYLHIDRLLGKYIKKILLLRIKRGRPKTAWILMSFKKPDNMPILESRKTHWEPTIPKNLDGISRLIKNK